MKCFFKELVNAIIVGIAIFAVFLAIAYVKEDTLDFDQKLLLDFGINMVYSITLYAVNRIVFMYYYNKYTVKKFCLQHLTYFYHCGDSGDPGYHICFKWAAILFCERYTAFSIFVKSASCRLLGFTFNICSGDHHFLRDFLLPV